MAGAGSERPLSLDDALAVVGDLLDRHRRKHGAVPDAVVVLGGTALAAHRIRLVSWGVDLYMPEIDDDVVAETWKEGVARYGAAFRLDATAVNTAWGPLAIRDIEASPEVATLLVAGQPVAIRALSPETVYVLKCEARREKDRNDLPPIARETGADRLIVRFNEMLPWHGDRARTHLFAAFFRDSVAQNCGLDPRHVEAKLALPETVKARMKELSDAEERRTELLFVAALRTSVDTHSADRHRRSIAF